MTLAFITAVLFCIYTYAVFPLLLHLRAQRQRRHDKTHNQSVAIINQSGVTDIAALPTVSVVLALHNEAHNLPGKFETLAALNYPQSLLQTVFVSDGSTDDTVSMLIEACQTRTNWHYQAYSPAAGKPTALNRGVAQASGEILVFMDARQRVSPNAIQALLAHLQDPSVGVVSGELVLGEEAGSDAPNVGLYWRYERWIRQSESILGSTTGATGALYAMRRSQYTPLPEDTILDDFDTPIKLLQGGLRTVLATDAKVYDLAEANIDNEFQRKVRTLSGNYQSFSRHPWLFSVRANPVWWQFLSHKVFRLLVPLALLIAFVTSMLGNSAFLKTMFVLQLVFYLTGVIGWLGKGGRIAAIVKLFLQLNAAAVIAAWRAVRGQTTVRWRES